MAMDTDLVVHVFGLTDVGTRRQSNEDAWRAGQLGRPFASDFKSRSTATLLAGQAPVLAVVSDGVGGANAGEVASEMAVSCIQEVLTKSYRLLSKPGKGGDLIRSTLEAADAAVRSKAAEPGKNGMCATLSLLCLAAPRLAWSGQAGDSRIYRFRQGHLQQITRDHSPVGRMRQDGLITEEEARRHPQRNQIDQSVGDTQNPFSPDVVEFQLDPPETFLLCSDGLSDGLWDWQIGRALARVRSAADVQPVVEDLVAEANRASGRDNITAIVLRVETAPIESGGPAT
jgi:serine/threonine protein phosphatase PrpC